MLRPLEHLVHDGVFVLLAHGFLEGGVVGDDVAVQVFIEPDALDDRIGGDERKDEDAEGFRRLP